MSKFANIAEKRIGQQPYATDFSSFREPWEARSGIVSDEFNLSSADVPATGEGLSTILIDLVDELDGARESRNGSNEVLVEPPVNNKLRKTPIVNLLQCREKNTSSLPDDDYDAIIQAANVIMSAYLICIMISRTLGNKSKYFDPEMIDCQRRKFISRALNFVSTSYEVSGRQDNKCYWADFMKYKFMAFYAYWLGQEHQLPLPPDLLKDDHPGYLIGGVYGRSLHLLREKEFNCFNYLVETINYLKKGMSSVPISYVKAKVKETATHLTNENLLEYRNEEIFPERVITHQIGDIHIQGTIPSLMFDTMDAIHECIRTTREIFYSPSKFDLFDLFRPYKGSINASYDKSKVDGGQAFEVARHTRHINIPDSVEEFLDREVASFDVVGEKCKTYGEFSRELDSLIDKNLWIDPDDSYKSVPGFTWNDKRLYEYSKECFITLWKIAINETNFAVPVGLSEPLKVRVIMKGRAAKYYCLRFFQKWMHSNMRHHPNLIAIGKPITEEMVNSFFLEPSNDIEYVNGDYQQSTNLIFSVISEAIGGELVDIFLRNFERLDVCWDFDPYFNENLKKMVIDCLTQHMIMVDSEYKKQATGQSMGSPVSFPVLCLANLAGARRTCELAEWRRIRLGKEFKCWVNGDDVTFSSVLGVFDIWIKVMNCFGLFSSPGKTFPSNSNDRYLFIMLNSMRFNWNGNRYELVPYINFGVLLGIKKSSVSTDLVRTKEVFELPSLQRDLLTRAPKEGYDLLNCIFLGLHKQSLQKYNIPWFLPKWLGGYGFLTSESYPLSDFDRRQATAGKIHHNEFCSRRVSSLSSWWDWELPLKGLPIEMETNFKYGRLEDICGDFDELFDNREEKQERNSRCSYRNIVRPMDEAVLFNEFFDLEEGFDEYMMAASNASFFIEVQRFYRIKMASSFLRKEVDDLIKINNRQNFWIFPERVIERLESMKKRIKTLTDLLQSEIRKVQKCFNISYDDCPYEGILIPNMVFEIVDVKPQNKVLAHNERYFKRLSKLVKEHTLKYYPLSDGDLLDEKKNFFVPLAKLDWPSNAPPVNIQ